MVHRVSLPKFDANITEATLGAWHKSEGGRVDVGDVLVDVVTDKANFELTAEASGTLRKIIAPEKSQVPLGYVVALVGDPGEALPDVAAENDRMMKEYLASVTGRALSAPPAQGARAAAAGAERVRATPRARRLAREHGIDLAELQKASGAEVVTEELVRKRIEGTGK